MKRATPTVRHAPRFWRHCGVVAALTLVALGEIAGASAPSGPVNLITVRTPPSLPPAIALTIRKTAELEKILDSRGFALDGVASGRSRVPALALTRLPTDFAGEMPVNRRKTLFISGVLPLILLANAEITADRARLRLIIAKGDANAQGRAWLDDQAARYGLAAEKQDTPPPVRLAQRLLRHVDTVPVSLALAQAAAESGWGRSRFAHDGNALYGQWTMSEGHGLVPQRRDAGKKHLVRQFGSLLDSVRAYMRNLNSHPAYRTFRDARATARGRGQALDGAELAHHLEAYSERGTVYIDELRAIMRVNRLGRFDGAILIPERRV